MSGRNADDAEWSLDMHVKMKIVLKFHSFYKMVKITVFNYLFNFQNANLGQT